MIAAPFRSMLLAAAVLGTAMAGAHPAAAQTSCDSAGAEAEQRYDVPAGLLRAIGRVESGRRDPITGQVAPWPWTINAEGRGQAFQSQAEALSGTRALQGGGIVSIDVGCFQVNLMHHPTAFPTLEDGFDPAHNADYAARFLQSLRARTGSWDAAVAAYHSATPELGIPYRDRVMAILSPGAAAFPAALPGLASAPEPPLPVVRVVTWSPPPRTAGMQVWTPSAPGHGASVIVMNASPVALAGARPRPVRAPRG